MKGFLFMTGAASLLGTSLTASILAPLSTKPEALYHARAAEPIDKRLEAPSEPTVVIQNLITASLYVLTLLLEGQGLTTAGILPTSITNPLFSIVDGTVNPFEGTPLGPPTSSPVFPPLPVPDLGGRSLEGRHGLDSGESKAGIAERTVQPPQQKGLLGLLDNYLAQLNRVKDLVPANVKNSDYGSGLEAAIRAFIAAVETYVKQIQAGKNPKRAAVQLSQGLKKAADELSKIRTQSPA